MHIMKASLVTTAFLLLAIGPALAHANLESSVPANAAIVTTAPTAITLKFSEGLELRFSGITITGPAGLVVPGAATLDPTDNTQLVVPLTTPLAAGTYSIDWHVLSTDGHKTKGSYAFTVK
jgi:methionine-rich copper-binding protein CopC